MQHERFPRAPDRFFIGGDWVAPATDRRIEVISPVTEAPLLSYPEAAAPDIDRAVAAARAAFDEGPWPRMAPAERAGYLRRIAALISARLEEIAQAWTAQVGAPIALTRKLVPQNATLFAHYAELAERHPFLDIRRRDDGGEVRVLREPVGVCAAIAPWNAPMVLMSYKIAAGLAAGCTMVAKPSPETPLEAYVLAECIEAAGLPRGVFNLVPAGPEGGEHLIRHPGIDKVAFTGSTAVGQHIMRVCADRLARVSLELGGKSAAVLLPDAEFARALPSLMVYSMPITGQVCFSLTRILVPEARKREFLDMFLPAVQAIRVGDPSDTATQMGPLAMARQRARVEGYIAAGRAAGARLVCRAHRLCRCHPGHDHRAGGDLRPGRLGDRLQRRGGRRPQGQRHPLRAERRGLCGRPGAGLRLCPADADGGCDRQRADRRSEASVRRLWRLRHGARGGAGGAGGLPRGQDRPHGRLRCLRRSPAAP